MLCIDYLVPIILNMNFFIDAIFSGTRVCPALTKKFNTLVCFVGFVGATVTPQHIVMNRNALFRDGLQPHNYCLPILKREVHSNVDEWFLKVISSFLFYQLTSITLLHLLQGMRS